MNFIKTVKKSQLGFSLVELMVVVAIIGVLATVAVPQINKFIAKARQSEAKTNLAAIYTANKAFFVEYNGYSGSFRAIGYAPEGQLRYNTGFASGATCPLSYSAACDANSNTLTVCGQKQAGQDGGTAALAGFNCLTMPGSDNAMPPALANAPPVSPFDIFRAQATARISNDPDFDTWQIDEQKNLDNISDGIN